MSTYEILMNNMKNREKRYFWNISTKLKIAASAKLEFLSFTPFVVYTRLYFF